jgi:hypothetical protein
VVAADFVVDVVSTSVVVVSTLVVVSVSELSSLVVFVAFIRVVSAVVLVAQFEMQSLKEQISELVEHVPLVVH